MARRRLYNYRGSLALSFHGCRREVAERLVANPDDIRISENDWDCAVINYLTSVTDSDCVAEALANGYSETKAFDSVRGCFHEGAKLDGMEIYEKTHIQIAIRNMNCIKAVFQPREVMTFPEV